MFQHYWSTIRGSRPRRDLATDHENARVQMRCNYINFARWYLRSVLLFPLYELFSLNIKNWAFKLWKYQYASKKYNGLSTDVYNSFQLDILLLLSFYSYSSYY